MVLTRVFKGRDSQDNPGRDVLLSLCPRSRAAAKIPGQNYYLVVKTNVKKVKNWLKHFFFQNSIFFPLFFFCPGGQDGTACKNPAHSVPSCLVPRPGFDRLYRPVPAHGKILSLSRCPFVPGQLRNLCPFVPRDKTVLYCWKP